MDLYLLDLLKYHLCTGYLIQIIILEEEGTIRHFNQWPTFNDSLLFINNRKALAIGVGTRII